MVREIKSKGIFEQARSNFTSIKPFAFLLFLILGAALTFYLITQRQDLRQRASQNLKTEYGFNTHLNATNGSGYWENLTIDFFKKTVDDLVANNQTWIRLNIAPWESATNGTGTSITWNEAALAKYDEAINYADSKGLKIYLITSIPDFANNYSPEDYKATTIKYHEGLANRYKGKIDIWQIYNEADTHNFKGYAALAPSDLTAAYLSELKDNFSAAKNSIKSIDSNILFTANVTGYPLENATFQNWNTFFDVIAPELDLLSLDIYPRGTTDVNIIKSSTIAVASKYSKPIIIAETGFPTGDNRFSESEQSSLLSLTVEELRAAQPVAILYYQYADTLPTTDITESSFGVVKADGSRKSSFTSIMQTMAAPTGLLRVQTDPAVGATITVYSLNTNQIILTKEWGVDWERLPTGTYRVEFSNPKNLTIFSNNVVLPSPQTIQIANGQTTTIVADLTKGTVIITPIQNSSTATPTSQPPTSTPIPTATLTPTKTPSLTPTPAPKTGLLRVSTSPATNATIRILNQYGKIISTTQWSVNWIPLNNGSYYVTFSYPKTAGLKTPPVTSFKILGGKTTEIIGNFSTGKTIVSYK